MKILKSSNVYYDPDRYASFPSLCMANDTVFCCFRVSPLPCSETHIDTRSFAIVMSSDDLGATWIEESRIYSEPFQGIQDPSIAYIDGWFYLNYFVWSTYEEKDTEDRKEVMAMGAFVRRSRAGIKWNKAIHVPGKPQLLTSQPAISLGGGLAMVGYVDLGGGGDCAMMVRRKEHEWPTWGLPKKITHDAMRSYQEPALLDCGGMHLLCMVRVPGKNLHQIHSWDIGETWEYPKETPIEGFPPSLLRLRDGRILCTYGYRKVPYGTRISVSRDEGLSWDIGDEIILFDEGGGWDVGYPSTCQLPNGQLLTAHYYFTRDDPVRRIEAIRWEL